MTRDLLATIPMVEASSSKIERCGVLPWRTRRDGSTRIMLVASHDKGGWTIPKGQPKKDEPAFLAAARAAFEEAGVIGDTYPEPVIDYEHFTTLEDGSCSPCRVIVFSMKVYGTLSHWPEEDQRQRRWLKVEEAAAQLDDVELASFILEHGPFPKGRHTGNHRQQPHLYDAGEMLPD